MEPPRSIFHDVAYVAATVLVGLAGAGFAIAFRLALHHGMALLLGRDNVLDAFHALPLARRVAIPAAGALCAGLVSLAAARSTAGHGVGAILEAVTLGRGRLSLGATLAKSLASYCALVTGGSLGREGSIVQFGASAGASLGRRLGLDPKRTRRSWPPAPRRASRRPTTRPSPPSSSSSRS